MEKDEKTVIDPVVDTTIDNNDNVVVEPTQDENPESVVVDNNTEPDPEPVTEPVAEPEPVVDPVTEPVVEPEPVVDPVVDAPVEEPTLAPTDDIIPAPVDVPVEEPVVDPVVADEPVIDPVIPEDPATLAPAEPVVDAPVEEPIVGPGPEAVPCDGCAGVDPAPCESPVTVANFFGTLQECVTIVWRYHLKTRKHHVHVDLNDFYQGALYKIDNIIEQYQGIVGIIEDPFTNCVVGEGKDEITYLQELKNFIETNKCVLGEHSEINSSIDEFLGLIDSTLYKLTSFCEHAVKSFDEFCYEDFNMNESCCHKIPKFSKGPEEDEDPAEEE